MEIFDDPSLIFRKRKGTTNKGNEYENLIIANLILTLLSDSTVKDFQISSNDANFGIFDDIVLDIHLNNGGVEKYAIQVKQSNDRILTKSSLTEKTGNFSLTKYLTDFRKLSRNDVRFCLYTNRNFDNSDKTTKDGRIVKFNNNVKIDDFELTIEKIDDFRLSTGNCYKFLSDPSDAFFDDFCLLTNQDDVDKIKDNIETYFRQFGCHEYCHKNYIDFVAQWSNREGKKLKLCKDIMRRKVGLILLSGEIHPLTVNGGHLTPEMVLLRNLTMSQNMSFSGNVKATLLDLWRDCDSELTNFEKVSRLTHLFQTKEPHILLWLMGKCPLFISRTSATKKAMSLCPDMSFVILDNSEKLSNSKLSNEILTTLKCNLQGKDIILDDLISRGRLIDVLTTDDLVKMTTFGFVIGEAETLPFAHIDRLLTRHLFDLTILDAIDFGSNGSDFVLITNYKNCQDVKHKILNSDDFLSKEEHNWEFYNGKVIFVTRNEYTRKVFDKICFLNSGKRHYHQFRLVSDRLEWVRTRGGIHFLSPLLVTDYLSESKLSNCQDDNRINIVCAGPGIGKTTLMRNLKNQTSPTLWTEVIYARNHCGYLKNPVTFVNHLLSEIDSSIREVVKILIDENRVRFIWDGLDQVSDKNLTLILDLIEEFDKSGIIQWITSRDNLRGILERRFGVLSRTIKEFDEDEQKRYIEKSLGCCQDALNDIFGKIKNNIRLFPDNDVLGIPLQIYLLTELLRRDRTRYQDLLDRNLFSIADLYEHFVDEKFNIYCQEKENVVNGSDLFVQRKHLFKINRIDQYEKLAIRNFNFDFDDIVKTLTIDRDPVGIIVSVKYHTVDFMHASFLEYFAASFLSKNFQLVVKISDFLSNKRYDNVRFFFDLLLSKNSRAHVAVLYKNVQLLKTCSRQDLQCKDGGGRNALQLACSWGQKYEFLSVDIIDYGLSLIDDKVYTIDDEDISEICRDSDEYCQIIDFLTTVCDHTGIDNLYQMTAMSYAYKSLCLMTFSKLLRTYKLNFKDFGNSDELCSIIYYCVALDFPDIFEIVKDIVKIRTTSFADLPYLAVVRNSIGCVKALTELYGYRLRLLMVASRRGFVDTVKYFIDSGYDINQTDDDDATPILAACRNGHYQVVKLLIDNGAIMDDRLIHVSVKKQHLDIVQLLVDNDINVNAVNTDGKIALQIANDNCDIDILKYLIVKDSNLDVDDRFYGSIIHRYCRLFDFDIVKLLLDNGADPNRRDYFQRTPLHIASASGHYDLVKLLIDNSAIVNATSDDGQTPLHQAKSPEIVKLLIDNHADLTLPDNFGNTALHIISGSKNLQSVKSLLQSEPGVNRQNKRNETPLLKACESGDYQIVKLLIDNGANVNLANINGNSPLHCSCQGANLNLVKLLIGNEADVNACNQYGEMPLHWSCEEGNSEIVKYLLDNGADVNAVTTYDETPLDMAKDVYVVKILKKYGAKKFNSLSLEQR